jgi:hypothetical protein
MANTVVILNFSDGTHDYNLPLVQSISDPQPAMKATVIKGNRADGCIIIPSGKEAIEINVEGILFDADGYADLTTLMGTMRTNVTTDPATLTLKHWNGATYVTDWAYSVRRIDQIEFPNSDDMRTEAQPYRIKFTVFSY